MPSAQEPILDKILSDLKSPIVVVKKRAIMEILKGSHHQALFALKEVALQDDDVEVRYFASKAFHFLKGTLPPAPRTESKVGDLTVESAAEILRTADADTKIRTLQQIVNAKDTSFLSLLLEISIEESDPMVRSVLPLAIGILGTKENQSFIIQRFLKDPNARVRANAIEALERIGSPDAYPYIVGFLQDKDNRVRTNAALALNKFGKVNLIRTLDGMLKDSKVWMRDSATYALSVIKIPEAVPLLANAMEDSYEGIRVKAKRALQSLLAKGVTGARDVLDRHPDVKDEESLEDFIRLGERELASCPVENREAAAPAEGGATQLPRPVEAAHGVGPQETRPQGVGPGGGEPPDQSQPSTVDDSREASATPSDGKPASIGPDSPPALPPPKGQYDLHSSDTATRIRELQRVVSAQDLGMGPLLVECLEKEQDAHVLATIAISLGRLGFRAATESLIKLLESEDHRVRANTVEALGLLQSEESQKFLIRHIKDPHPRVVANALWALKDYPFLDIYPHIETMSLHRKEEFRRSSIWLISRLKTLAAIRFLERLVHQDRSADIRSRATKLLGELRDQGNTFARSLCGKLKIR